MSEKKRKRRSFWEPDSEKLVSWLDDQSDLGRSLQLIIVDAIHKYGEGDVIMAHLNQRENPDYEPAPQKPRQKVASKPEPRTIEPSDEQDESTFNPVSEPEEEPVSGGGLEQEPEVELDSDSELEFEEEFENNDGDDEPFDINSMSEEAGHTNESEQEEEDEVDPISIMMQDIDSTFSK